MTAGTPRVAVLVVSWNGRAHLETCLAALAEQHAPGVPWETWVLDNGSRDGTVEWLRRSHPTVRVVQSPRNLGFAAGVNHLAGAVDAELVALLNNDTRPRPEWLGELVGALLTAPAEVSAVAGCILDWEGERLDFGRGVVTFDGHAFQLDFRRPLAAARMPRAGEELFFGCGGNLLLRRDRFLAAGGFDPAFFAYYEDVDLGWRLWARGERILSAPGAVVHHRSGATSDQLGPFRRGFLFERNAFLTVYKNLDAELWPRLMPAVLLTLLSRSQYLLAHHNPGGELLAVDPYAEPGRSAASRSPGAVAATASAASAAAPAATAATREAGRFGNLRRGDLGGAWRSVRRRLGGWLTPLDGGPAHPVLADPRTVAQLQAVSALLGGLDGAAERRRVAQASRRVPDRELLARFPLWLVPTYPGDQALFASAGFRAWLPPDLPLIEARLEEVMQWE
jgi:GT2 family glycosyltransferase